MMQKRQPDQDKGRRAEQSVLAVFPRSIKVDRPARNSGADLTVNGQPLTIKWVGQGHLGDIRPFLKQRRNRPNIIVARQMSPGARKALSEAGIGWVDETGAAEIAIGSIIVSRTGTSPEQVDRPKRWTPAVMAIAEAVLCDVKPTISDTQAATGLSTGSCTNALRFLSDQRLLEADAQRGRRSARRIADADKLLKAYATAVEALPPPLELQVGVTWRDPVTGIVEAGKKWRKANVAWATTGAAAASVIAPYLTTVTHAAVYVDVDTIVGLESIAIDAGLRPIEGGRLTLKPFPTVAVQALAQMTRGLQVAPWPRIYVDLRNEGVRGEDAAEHLLEVINVR